MGGRAEDVQEGSPDGGDNGLISHHLEVVKSKKRIRGGDGSSKVKNFKKKQRDEEMGQLEHSLFGTLYSKVEFGTEDVKKESVLEDSGNGPVFMLDNSGDQELLLTGGVSTTGALEPVRKEKGPAWFDEDDERTEVDIMRSNRLRKLREENGESLMSGVQYVQRLRAQHAKLNPGTDWARKEHRDSCGDASDDDNEDVFGHDSVFRSSGDLVVKGATKLLPGLLGFTRLADANAEEPSNAPINSVQFHRNGQLLLAAGFDKRVRFFQIDGKRNPKIESICVEDCPAYKACFSPDGSEVFIAGRRKHFYTFDLVKAAVNKIGPLTGREEKSLETFEVSPDSSTIAFVGNEGCILLVSSKTKELIGTVKMNGSARSLAFADGGNQLLSGGGDGQIYFWDLRMRRCIHKATDEGSLTGSSLCTSQDSCLIAAGSTTGVVNVYRKDELLGGKGKPLKSIENVTTAVHEVKFNPDAQILALCSRLKKRSLKLVHVPSYTVFSNWPGSNVSLHYPRCLDFSPGSGFLTVGNAEGKVLLYKLHHYQNA